MTPLDLNKLFEVYTFAKDAHESINQKRESGEDYITHPIIVAQIALNYKANQPTILACLLHDVIEDTPITLEQITDKFGQEVAFLVDGVTKLETPEKTFNKIKQYSEKDSRVIQIKLADRIHNVDTIMPKTIPKYKISTPRYIKLGEEFGYKELVKELKRVSKIKLV